MKSRSRLIVLLLISLFLLVIGNHFFCNHENSTPPADNPLSDTTIVGGDLSQDTTSFKIDSSIEIINDSTKKN